MPVERVKGSFRDPSGFVFRREGRIFRALDDVCHQILAELDHHDQFEPLIARELIVDTQFVNGTLRDDLRKECPGVDHFLEHEVVPSISYPYEWSVSMLADAGIHTLDLQIELLESGCSLKDATAYNIQFVEGRPKMIDVASIERPKRLDLWFALGQFLQMFLYPLLLHRYRGWDLRSYFVANINGRHVEEVARSFGWLQRLRPSLFLDLTLPWWLHRLTERSGGGSRESLEKPVQNCDAQIMNLKRLKRKIRKLSASYKPRGLWSEYTQICNYDQEAEGGKKKLVGDFLSHSQPSRVLDLGCNTGDYSMLAADHGAEVIAVDADHDAIELLYRKLRDRQRPILPLVVDLANPSPAIGYMNVERPSFFERTQADCVLALALMHHLLVSANMSLPGIRDMLHGLTRRDLVLEFVPRDDNMFERLMNFRVDLFQDLSVETCKRVFEERFEILREELIPGSKRSLLFLRKT